MAYDQITADLVRENGKLRAALERIEQERGEVQSEIAAAGLGADMRDIGYLEGLERALEILRGGDSPDA